MFEATDTQLLRFYLDLTPRQRDVVRLVSRGLSNQDVADQLYIASSVVAGHLTTVYDLLDNLGALDTRPNRYTLVRLFSAFFDRYPEM